MTVHFGNCIKLPQYIGDNGKHTYTQKEIEWKKSMSLLVISLGSTEYQVRTWYRLLRIFQKYNDFFV